MLMVFSVKSTFLKLPKTITSYNPNFNIVPYIYTHVKINWLHMIRRKPHGQSINLFKINKLLYNPTSYTGTR